MIDLQKERNTRRQKLIARAWHVSIALRHASETIKLNVESAKTHNISEWELAETTQQEVLTLFVECGLTELMEAFTSFALVNQALSYTTFDDKIIGQKTTT
jgi:hypothetical protein